GVNFAIEQGEGRRSPEWMLLGIQPEPWTATDINNMVIVSSDMATDGERELRIAAMEQELSPALRDFALTPLDLSFPTLYEDFHATNSQRGAERTDLGAGTDENAGGGQGNPSMQTGTNFFVLGRDVTASGHAILAVDPHLPTHSPSVVYPVRVTLPDDFIAGGAWIGTPAVVFGQNSRIAWGMTHLYADTFDYIVERVDPDDPNQYLTPEGPRAFDNRAMTVQLRGGESRQVNLRSTHRGPVVSDPLIDGEARSGAIAERHQLITELYGPGHVLVRRDVPSDAGYTSMQALLNVSRAHNWPEFRAALRDYEWSNNVAFADTEGNIGVQMAAKLPKRKQQNGWNGQRLARGWLGEGDWDGYIAFDELPYIYNPPQGWAADSNSRAVRADHPFRVSDNFSPPWRVMRAYELIGSSREHTLDSVASIQLDVHSTKAAWLTQRLIGFNSTSDTVSRAQELLKQWDFTMVPNRPEPLLYSAIELLLQERILNTLGPRLARKTPNTHQLIRIFEDYPEFCDSPDTPESESCEQVFNQATIDAITTLEEQFGSDWQRWRWGDLHAAVFPAHYSWRYMPVLGELTETRVVTPGGQGVLNQGSVVSRQAPMDDLLQDLDFEQKHGATFRLIADLGDPSKSRMAFAPGMSANVASPHWDDAAAPWAAGLYESLLDSGESGVVTLLRPTGL
ncbi:MAG: penicillin acylase family protein, partial [Pseudomonadota bacterium]